MFTQEPNSPVHLLEGENGDLVWKYSVNDKAAEFNYVTWNIFSLGNSIPLLSENATGYLTLEPTAPAAYIGRVNITGQATLVIKNVNTSDNGVIFQCILWHKSGDQNVSSVRVVVTGKCTFSIATLF